MDCVYHLNLNKEQVEGAGVVLFPGDPFRVPQVADEVRRQFGGQTEELAWKREYRSFLCRTEIGNILIASGGIGGPSTSIAIEELAMLGVGTFIRIGTSGAIQEYVNPGDVIITTASVRLDGASTHYAPIEYPAAAHHELVNALKAAAEKHEMPYHVGITASSDTFYPGQERYDSFTGHVLRRFKGSMNEWQSLNVLNYEMESSTVLTLCSAMGLRGACVCAVVVNRATGEAIREDHLAAGEANVIKTAVSSLEFMDGCKL